MKTKKLAPGLRELTSSCGFAPWQVQYFIVIYHFTFHMSWITNCCAVICGHNCRVFFFRSGHLLGLPCVDHLHYLLSVANVFLARGEDETKMRNGGGMDLLIMKYETKYRTRKWNKIWEFCLKWWWNAFVDYWLQSCIPSRQANSCKLWKMRLQRRQRLEIIKQPNSEVF